MIVSTNLEQKGIPTRNVCQVPFFRGVKKKPMISLVFCGEEGNLTRKHVLGRMPYNGRDHIVDHRSSHENTD